MKKVLMAIVALGVLSLLSAPVQAACNRPSAQVVRVTISPGAANSYIHYRDDALSNFYWYCATTDAKLLDAALAAQNGLTKAEIRGDAPSCPTTSAANGARSAGFCLRVVVNP
jgi:uncharacterized membrane protein